MTYLKNEKYAVSGENKQNGKTNKRISNSLVCDNKAEREKAKNREYAI